MTYGVIMAGGKGTRLWPEGRKTRPKQLLDLIDHRPMIRVAVDRLAPLIPVDRQIIVTTREYASEIARALPAFPAENILVEPLGKDTAPCIGWAALKVTERDPAATMAVVTADHFIADETGFREVLHAAVTVAENAPLLVVVGFVPLRPDTGLGYIRFGHETREIEGIQFYRVDEFVEKPNKAKAIQYVEDGRYLWNSGMFVMQARHALNLFSRFLPRHFALLEEIKSSLGTPDEPAVTENAYQRFDRVSLDVGIMEKADNVEVIRADFGWLDIGTWAALDQISLHDARGNVVRGQHVGLDTERCIIRTSNSVVATMGVHDLVIIETDAAVLVCPKSRVQEVKNLVETLEKEGREDVT